ncbi:MAG: twin-arginine translocation signal domain-containing protein, partial [Deltaproteobacteria bacterium]|nr:twin-arginine translocation signal domain-containing protein [Deltaproteobacteria bacterium]
MADLKALETSLRQGKLSRRDFLARLSALGIAVAISPTSPSTSVHAKEYQKGGRLRLGLGGGSTTDSLDPAMMTDAMAYNINWQIRNNLLEINHKGDLVPELAQSWDSSLDAKK